jgi:hypothetical protein
MQCRPRDVHLARAVLVGARRAEENPIFRTDAWSLIQIIGVLRWGTYIRHGWKPERLNCKLNSRLTAGAQTERPCHEL